MTTDSSWMLFSDESGIHPGFRCYGIGLLTIPTSSLDAFNGWFEKLRDQHGVQGEVKWKKVGNSHGLSNFGIDLLKAVLRKKARFELMVVKKDVYRKWRRRNEEKAFYLSFTFLLRHRLDLGNADYTVLMDDRSDRYSKQHEVVEKVTNYMASQIDAQGRLTRVSKADSRHYPGIQAADMLTGAITSAHNQYLHPQAGISPGKQLLIDRLASVLGWDALHYDTYPEDKFNIWHFPEEWRADPATKRIQPNYGIPFVTADELEEALSR